MKQRVPVDLARYRYEKALNNLTDAKDAYAMGRYENSVGRAYYCIFSAMRALLALKELDSKSHAGVFALFNQHFVKHKLFPRGFSKMIREAKQVREKADYGDFEHVGKDIAARLIESAETFLQRVDTTMRQMIVKANGK